MTAQKGRDLLLKVDADGLGAFQTVAGLRSHALAFNAERVDITNQESAGAWRELLEGAGLKSANIRGSGIFKDAASDATMRSLFFAATIRRWAGLYEEVLRLAAASPESTLGELMSVLAEREADRRRQDEERLKDESLRRFSGVKRRGARGAAVS